MAGKRFGRLLVIERDGQDKSGAASWACRCDCGAIKTVSGNSLRRGATSSCGCLSREIASKCSRTHGASRGAGGAKTIEYALWSAMRQRCTNPAHPKFHRYGGRGINVCDRWQDFANFLADMGPQPPGMTIERKDNDGPYSPSNCRWAPMSEQARNRSTSILWTHEGRTMCLSEWARHFGIHIATVQARIRKGASIEDALTSPLRRAG